MAGPPPSDSSPKIDEAETPVGFASAQVQGDIRPSDNSVTATVIVNRLERLFYEGETSRSRNIFEANGCRRFSPDTGSISSYRCNSDLNPEQANKTLNAIYGH